MKLHMSAKFPTFTIAGSVLFALVIYSAVYFRNTVNNAQTLGQPVITSVFEKAAGEPKLTTNQEYGGYQRTSSQKHIVFLRTHKTGSSTILSILLVYGTRNNLTFVLPKDETCRGLGWPEPFDPAKHAREMRGSPDILCLHSVFSSKLVSYMPKDSFYFTTVRDPFTQLKSAYIYYKMHSITKRSLSQLVTAMTESHSMKSRRYGGGYMSNPILRDLGLNSKQLLNESVIDEYISYLDSRLDLVIVVEYFDESLILLRDRLGWTENDILSFSKNFHKYNDHPKKSSGQDLSDTPENRERVYRLSAADTKLYLHFKRKLEAIISRDRDYFRSEVRRLQSARQQWMEYCVDKAVPGKSLKDSRFRLYGDVAFTYQLTDEGLNNQTCLNLAISEISHYLPVAKI